jgi:hypothetical protein
MILIILGKEYKLLFPQKSVNFQNLLPKVSIEVSKTRMKVGKAKHKIQILGDSHVRGLANELKYKLLITKFREWQNQDQH